MEGNHRHPERVRAFVCAVAAKVHRVEWPPSPDPSAQGVGQDGAGAEEAHLEEFLNEVERGISVPRAFKAIGEFYGETPDALADILRPASE